jgi:hypothetical protein
MISRLNKTVRSRGWSPAVMLASVLLLTTFGWAFSRFYIPGKGFTYLVAFGSKEEARRIDALKSLNYYVENDSFGYDAQYYVQIAMDPTLRDPQLKGAVDNLPYRARRILISWAAYVMGGGRPAAILKAYVLQNAIIWFLLAFTLWWWFPPSSWSNFLRWGGVLFSFGICVSVRNSLVDGPSLFLIAFGVMLLESGRRWGATAVLALSGMGKETNLLGGAALVEVKDLAHWRRWPVLGLRGLLLVLPFALWLYYIQSTVGPAVNVGARNFDWPLLGYGRKWHDIWLGLFNPANWHYGWYRCGPLLSGLMMVALTVQGGFLLCRPAPRRAWWRVGLSFAVLMLVLGDAVWEGFPGAASRVLLPMQLAFNVLVPYGRRWLPVLILGNLTLVLAPTALEPPLGDSYKLQGPEQLVEQGENGLFRIQYSRDWYQSEKVGDHYWRWCGPAATVTLINPHAFPIEAGMTFILSSLGPKTVTITTAAHEVLWQGGIGDHVTRGRIERLRLAPGRNVLHFAATGGTTTVKDDPRDLAFCLKDWVVTLAPAPQDGVVLMARSDVLHPDAAHELKVTFDDGWYPAERNRDNYWRWSKRPADVIIDNPQGKPLHARIGFVLNAISKRQVTLTDGSGRVLWAGEVASRHSEEVDLPAVTLGPGANHFRFTSDRPSSGADGDTRLLDLCLKNLRIEVTP